MPNFKKFVEEFGLQRRTLPEPVVEAPIDNIKTIGNFDKGSSFRSKTDRAILQSPKGIEKIKNKWAKTEHTYDMYFLNSKEAAKYNEKGMVDLEFVHTELNLPDFKINPDAITIIYTGNSGDERVQISPWILAHRFGHGIVATDRGNFSTKSEIGNRWTKLVDMICDNLLPLFKDGYEVPAFRDKDWGVQLYSGSESRTKGTAILTSFFQTIGTMKSARDKNLRSPYEFYYELLAQYLFEGKVHFNPIPKVIRYGKFNREGVHFRGTPSDLEYYDGYMKGIEDEFFSYADYLLGACVGKIFVM